MLLILCIIIIICLLSGIYIYLYNRIQDYIVKINEIESIIDTNLRNKYDNINRCVSIIKNDEKVSKELDKNMFEEVVRLRNRKISNFDLDRKLIDANNQFITLKEKYPKKVDTIKYHLDQIHVLEQKNCLDLDEVSGHFGHIMASICVYQDDIFKEDLYQMGFYLGKFIYLIDAFEDVEEDIKKQTYNPFKEKFKDEHFQEDCFHLLEMMISNSSFYFEKLPLIENVELLRNIIYSGIWTKFELIKKKRMEEKS